ncbi:MAG TPA: hypothetical protein EYO33_21075 [Phycisphaerales bacterium]|nr:hypothetical protein [Phycisphaerales bacterium]
MSNPTDSGQREQLRKLLIKCLDCLDDEEFKPGDVGDALVDSMMVWRCGRVAPKLFVVDKEIWVQMEHRSKCPRSQMSGPPIRTRLGGGYYRIQAGLHWASARYLEKNQ